jgi:tRNA-2-methylthio-N6-dimethylallyladenosine synthase
VSGKTFYIETFGCQMNAHNSEEVVGTLLSEGYAQVETPEEAHLVLYNTCSIRDKAEQKAFNRLQSFKYATGNGRIFGVLRGVTAARVPERIVEKRLVSDHVPLYRHSASLQRDAGVEIAPAMGGWVMRVGELLLPIVDVVRRELHPGAAAPDPA